LNRAAAIVVLLLALAALPLLIHSDFWMNFAIMALYFGLIGQSWNILGGYGGQFSFGHAAFFGMGAYAQGVLQTALGLDPWLCLIAAALLAAVTGTFVGALSFRSGLRGSYFALVTLAFAEVFRILANSVGFTGAGSGLLVPLKHGAANLQFETKAGFFWMILALTAGGIAIAWWIENSRFGSRLIALRENEDAARALGVDVLRTKLIAITLSAALMGLAGAFYVQYFLYIDPSIAFGPGASISALLVPIIGGLGTALGPLVGAVLLQFVSQLAQATMGDSPGLNLVAYGVILVAMVLFLPNGVIGQATVSARRIVGWRA
jgi:branched-chain amino acid transport system permease protein